MIFHLVPTVILICIAAVNANCSSFVTTTTRKPGCAADNCARQVTGTVHDTSSRRADCSRFMLTVVTPDVVTATSTATQTLPTETKTSFVSITVTTSTLTIYSTATEGVDITDSAIQVITNTEVIGTASTTVTETTTSYLHTGVVKRAISSSLSIIPAYATACSGVVRYSSACSCWGITPTQSTLDASTTTIVIYETINPPVTVTSTVEFDDTSTTTAVATETLTYTLTLTRTIYTSATKTSITTTSTIISHAPCATIRNSGFEDGLSPWVPSVPQTPWLLVATHFNAQGICPVGGSCLYVVYVNAPFGLTLIVSLAGIMDVCAAGDYRITMTVPCLYTSCSCNAQLCIQGGDCYDSLDVSGSSNSDPSTWKHRFNVIGLSAASGLPFTVHLTCPDTQRIHIDEFTITQMVP
ncbi:hypothetical protein TWF225_009700 [Orbilia oligospora]|nr:hypothetical protein TWF225_009700 [Orbilia oligospora]KAF3244322.1 hypothetical protein TWF128_009716 [Orbilia oligospora]KAF3247067.1 hypothetical protein TWF217_009724 [Orbilia oligospora]KAF3295650.1 hypothetical protein TWF132_000980 [Orbilia oligospora]